MDPARLTEAGIHDECRPVQWVRAFFSSALAFADTDLKDIRMFFERGRPGFDGDDEAKVAGRGAGRSSLKPSINIIANDNYDYAMAA